MARTKTPKTNEQRARAARWHLTHVTKAQSAAMRACPPDVLASLLRQVVTLTASDHGDIGEHASLVVAHCWQGMTGHVDPWEREAHAAKRARSVARTAVKRAWQWERETTEALDDGTARLIGTGAALPRLATMDQATLGADHRFVTTVTDVIGAALVAADSPSLTRAAQEWREHAWHADEDGRCHRCRAQGRTVEPLGITAHREGWTKRSHPSEYDRARRAILSGVASVDREAVLSGMGGAPLAGRATHGSVHYGDTRRATVHPSHVGPVTVTAPDGTRYTREQTEAEAEQTRAPLAGERAPERAEARPGEGGGTGPMVDTRRDGGRVRTRPRKGGGTGQTGSSVPASRDVAEAGSTAAEARLRAAQWRRAEWLAWQAEAPDTRGDLTCPDW